MVLPLTILVGCAAAPPPAATAPAAPGTSAAGEAGAGAAASAAPQAMPPKEEAARDSEKKTGEPAPIGKAAAATDAPLATTISQDEIFAQVQKHADVFNRCYTIGAGASKSYRAKVTIKATVGPNGAVNAAEVQSSTAKNPKVDACVAEGFKKLTFTRPKGASTTVFTFPMSFDGMEQVQ